MMPALLHHASYGQTPDSVRGILGQWGTLKTLLGAPVYYLFVSAFLYFFIKIILWQLKKIRDERERLPFVSIVILAVVIFDLPIMVSYNYQPRFFIPLIPLLSALSALFVGELLALIKGSKYAKAQILIPAGAVLIVVFGLLRVASVSLLIQNDPRIAAGEFIETLPSGTSLEYTLYPPVIPENHFEREHTYPIFFVKFLGQSVPPVQRGKPYRAFNEGEAGLEDRETDYFVIDSFTYARFANDYVCETNPVECDFFERLLAGETSYQLIGDFKYSLPKFLPQLSISFVNPEIRVYERVEK
ncbi:MAG: hypothetical protein GXP40_12615 [Chloroflexi bacterium]|nr:hypothetical protein [Chloroflexota bacterium]